MRFLILVVCVVLFIDALNAQDARFFQQFNQDMNLTVPLSYAAPAMWTKNLIDTATFTEPEGKKGFLIEANIFLKIPLWQKSSFYNTRDRNNNKIRPLFGYSRFFIDYGVTSRVARDVPSLPSLPITNRYGLRLDRILLLRYKGQNDTSFKRINFTPYEHSKGFECLNNKDSAKYVHKLEKNGVWSSKLANTIDDWKKWKSYFYIYGSAYFHHYSNGGTEGAIDSTTNRNDYIAGNFSTSFRRFSLGVNIHQSKSHSNKCGETIRIRHYLVEVGFQRELGGDSTFFEFEKGQKRSYGRRRLMATLQVLQGFQRKRVVPYFRTRLDIEYILTSRSNMTNYTYAEIGKYHKFNIHAYATLPLRYLAGVELMVHYFRGRDYLNIRYDNPVQIVQVGLVLDLFQYSFHGQIPVAR